MDACQRLASPGVAVPEHTVLHVPHDSTHVPLDTRDQFVLDDAELELELLRMTDAHTLALFAGAVPAARVVRAPVSRLVVDVERFEDDALELMVSRGMGAIYTRTSEGEPLRRPLAPAEREALLARWYRPHHAALEACVDRALDAHGRATVVDVHSFPRRARPYELVQDGHRPEICLGTDAFHTPARLLHAMRERFEGAGFEVDVDRPFAGALVPASRWRVDARVAAIMIEVRRDLYMDEGTGERLDGFHELSARVEVCVFETLDAIDAS